MNALDQAFIKAFAKNGTGVDSHQSATSKSPRQQPPEAGVESVALVVRDQGVQGRRLRLDRPTTVDGASLSAHMSLPIVQQVQSYQPADIATSTLAQVVVEDSLQALEDVIRRQAEAARAPRLGAPTSGTPAPGSAKAPVDPVAEALKPLVLLAVPRLCRPDLQHKQLGCLFWRQDGPVRHSTTATHIGHFDLNPALLDVRPTAQTPAPVAADAVDAVDAMDATDAMDAMDAMDAADAADDAANLAEDLATCMSGAGNIDQVVFPLPEEPVPAALGLSDAEEAALLGQGAPLALEPLAPAWEVDAFRWPEVCAQLDAASGGKLTQSGGELRLAVQDGLKVIAVTSTERHEGRTTLALALARSAAVAGCRVALLDADCAHPELARNLGLDSPCDWQRTRRIGQPMGEAAVASLDDHVTLFPLTVADTNLSGRLDDAALGEVLGELKRSFDLVVVDAQPVSESDPCVAARVEACAVDMVLVVRNTQTTTLESCLSSVARVRAMGVRAIGIVENFAPADAAAV